MIKTSKWPRLLTFYIEVRKMNIGGIKLGGNLVLAPMAGVTDLGFRTICKEFGADLVFTEMISAKGLYYKDEKTYSLSQIKNEGPVGLQIFGSDPDIMAYVVENDLNYRDEVDIIDINMGCPAPKIVKNQEGSALTKDPKLVRQILRQVVKVANKPITIKIRTGWDRDNLNALDIAKIAEEEGVSGLTIHGRTRDMFYSGRADWDFIAKVKESVTIPVIGNGDIFQPEDGIKMLKETRCDGIAIGRGARGNPWIFQRIKKLKNGQDQGPPGINEVVDTIIRHLDLLCKFKGEDRAVREIRKHIAWYLKGKTDSSRVRNKIYKTLDREEIKNILLNYLKNYHI